MVGVGGWVDVVVNRGLKGSVSLMIGVRVWYGSVSTVAIFVRDETRGPVGPASRVLKSLDWFSSRRNLFLGL